MPAGKEKLGFSASEVENKLPHESEHLEALQRMRTLDAYYEANMDLIAVDPDPQGPVAQRVLEREVPQIAGKIAYSELSTPLSTRHFGDYSEGEIYGLEHTPERFKSNRLRPKSPVPGLWLTGQDVCTAGVAGALFGATLSASAILGRNLLKEIGRGSLSAVD